MPAKLLINLGEIDLENVAVEREEIERINPQRYEFQQITHVCHFDPDAKIIVGVRDIREDEFWIRGHLPGRPIFPGVLLLEVAAQLSTICTALSVGLPSTYGFGGTDKARFRRMVKVGDRLVVVARGETVSPSRSRYSTQGVVDGQVAFEASVFGIALPGKS